MKHMKYNIIKRLFLLSLLIQVPLFADELVLYSHRHYPSDDALFQRFTGETGITIRVVKADADQLIERLRAEGVNTPADLLITADAGRLAVAKEAGLLQPVDSEVLRARIPDAYRDPDQQWFGFTVRARVLVYAKDRVRAEELSTYEALTERRWRGRLLSRSSSHVYNQSLLSAMVATHGEEEALRWARGVRANMARPPQGNDRDQMRAVAAGLGDVALVNTYYLGLMVESPDASDREIAGKLAIFFPNQEDRGVHVNISGGGVVRSSSRPELARRFLEFLVSEEAQSGFPAATSEYPVVDGIALSELQEKWGRFKADPLNLGELGKHNATAVRIFNRAGWE